MTRPAATIVIPAWNAWDDTSACLDALEETLSPGDRVLVVDNGSTDETAACLSAYSWLDMQAHPTNLGHAAACNLAAREVTTPIVVFLHNDTIVAPGWLDDLLVVFDSADVVAAGPRSNTAAGVQHIDAPYFVTDQLSLRDFTYWWRARQSGSRQEAHRLDGFCLAVRPEAFLAVGGFDEKFGPHGCAEEDLCLKLTAAGGQLLVVDDAFVHHEGRVTFERNGIDYEEWHLRSRELLHERSYGAPSRPWPLPLQERQPEAGDPRISVLIPTFNRPALLRRALTGVACSLGIDVSSDVEIIVVNDGGLDVSPVIAEFTGTLSVRLITSQVNRGRAAAMNTAVQAARGTYLAFLDDDDVYLPGHLAAALRELQSRPELGAIYTYAVQIEEDAQLQAQSRRIVGDESFEAEVLAARNLPVRSTVVLPAAIARGAGGFDERMPAYEDWEFLLRVSAHAPLALLAEPTVEYRFRPGLANTSRRTAFRVPETMEYVYGQHPVPPATRPDLLRRACKQENGTAEYPFELSFVIACAGDIEGLLRTIASATSVKTEGRWELVLCVPSVDDYALLLSDNKDDVQIYAAPGLTVDEAWELGAVRAGGRIRLNLREGEMVDANFVLHARRGAAGSGTEVGRPAPTKAAVSAPLAGHRI